MPLVQDQGRGRLPRLDQIFLSRRFSMAGAIWQQGALYRCASGMNFIKQPEQN